MINAKGRAVPMGEWCEQSCGSEDAEYGKAVQLEQVLGGREKEGGEKVGKGRRKVEKEKGKEGGERGREEVSQPARP